MLQVHCDNCVTHNSGLCRDQPGRPERQPGRRNSSSHAALIYQQQLDGFGHTQFEFGGTTQNTSPFLPCRPLWRCPALAVVVAEQQFARPVTSENTSLIVNIVGKPAVAGAYGPCVSRGRRQHQFPWREGSVDLTGTNVLIGVSTRIAVPL